VTRLLAIRWSRRSLLVVGAALLLPVAASASSIALTSSHLTTLSSCGLMSYPSSAGLTNDVYVDEAAPGANDVASANLAVSSGADANERTYIRFPLSSCLNPIPAGATVRSATLRLFSTAMAPTCRTVDVFAVPSTPAWSDSAITWNNEPVGTTINNPAASQRIYSTQIGAGPCTYQTLNAYVNFDVTSDVVKFVAGTATNYGWMLRDDTEGSSSVQLTTFASRRGTVAGQAPTLMISYTT
jgi:hypothetical protein